MQRTFSFGKVAYFGKRKINEVALTVELTYWDKRVEFTAWAEVWNNIHSDIVAGGQMIEPLYNEFARLRQSILYEAIFRLWKEYHMKDVRNIPAEDHELIGLLFSGKGKEEIEGILKDRKSESISRR